ncbi:MAG: CrcB family protein [Pikeienuella sp.]
MIALPGTVVCVAIGGALGASLRFLLIAWVGRVAPGFPWGTLAVNILGSFAMGILAALLLERGGLAGSRSAAFLLSGLLGGFTTFSAFSLDLVALIERGHPVSAIGYGTASVALSVSALAIGLLIGRTLRGV